MNHLPSPNPSDHSGVWIPPPLIYVITFLAAMLLQNYVPLPSMPDVLGRAGGLTFIVMGAVTALWSVRLFRLARTSLIPIKPTTALVTSGLYRFTRNPMYLGLLSVYLGAAILKHLWWAVLLMPMVIVAVRYLVIRKEELYLERKFRGEFVDYKARVRRWL